MKIHCDSLYDLFYRCRFEKILGIIEQLGARDFDSVNVCANALLELNRIDEAKNLLLLSAESVRSTNEGEAAFLRGRAYYIEKQYKLSEQTFQTLADSKESPLAPKALAAFATLSFCRRDFLGCENILNSLDRVVSSLTPDIVICLKILRAYLLMNTSSTFDAIIQNCQQAMSIATAEGWNYWIIDSLFAAATAQQIFGLASELKSSLQPLHPLVSGSRSLLKAGFLQDRFGSNVSCQEPIQVDRKTQQIKLNDRWVGFNGRTLIFEFFSTLFGSDEFVSKAAIANRIWPEEIYSPSIHDKRIFNLANRLREEFAIYPDRPIALLSGRLGYKLMLSQAKSAPEKPMPIHAEYLQFF